VATLAALICAAPQAYADKKSKPKAGGDEPFSDGVSKARQDQAIALFEAGNKLFEEEKYPDALDQYEKAIKKWDHPKIEFNLALCYVRIKKPLEAFDHIERALQYGKDPLGQAVYSNAIDQKATLEATLAELEVSGNQDDVKVMLDGQELFTGKSSAKRHLLAGPHQLVATRDGFETETRALNLPPGELTKQAVELQPEKVKVQVTRENYERRWQWWIPWTTVASGVGLALIGTGVYLAARSDIHAYDTALTAACPMGCTSGMIDPKLTAQETHARTLSGVGIGFWVAGGAVAAAAGVMAVLNRPHLEVEGHPADVSIVVTPQYTGATFTLSFR
jgi:tetratricopeptide (TPR) repeat protein